MKINFDRELIEKCQTNAPRYTSYPTADKFTLDYTAKNQYIQIDKVFDLNCFNEEESISLYVHIPFCNTLCLFCGCNKIITNNREHLDRYIDYLEMEIKLYYDLIKIKLHVIQLHFGGGSPSLMNQAQLARVMGVLRKYFILDHAKEIAMEIDPRNCNANYVKQLSQEGFNRISIGVQDFNPVVQKAVNRIQSFEESNAIILGARACGMKSSNLDLIYGLPFQTLDSFSETIETVIKMRPDRIALFNYAHIPSLLMPQTRIKEHDLPGASVKLDILQMSVNKLIDSGYIMIGMDHFALPDDDLAIAFKNNSLQRNFQGYSTFKDTNMLGFGISSIGFIGNSYYQNVKDLASYYLALDNQQLPILRGILLSQDDIIRRDIIQKIMCKYALDYCEIERDYNLNFAGYFKVEGDELKNLEQLGLISFSDRGFDVSQKGRFLIRNVAVVFDAYYRQNKGGSNYSKVI